MNSSSYPLISIVIPTFNRADFVGRTIDSALSQSYQNIEIIVVDDGSKDSTCEVVSSFNNHKIKYIKHQKNFGANEARNTGIKAAMGEWIAFLDSDDYWSKTKLEDQVNLISSLPNNYGVIHCGIINIDYKTGKILSQRISKGNINELVKRNIGIIPQTSTMLIRKDVFIEVGLFDIDLPAHQECELGIRIAQRFKFKLVDKNLVYVTRNHFQIMGNHSSYIEAKEIIIRKHKNNLSRELLCNFCKIIAGYSIINKQFPKAEAYLKDALKYKFKIKTVFALIMLYLTPNYTYHIYRKKYSKVGLVK